MLFPNNISYQVSNQSKDSDNECYYYFFWLIYHGLNDNKHNDVMCTYSVEDNINKEYQSPFRETGSRPLILTYNKIS